MLKLPVMLLMLLVNSSQLFGAKSSETGSARSAKVYNLSSSKEGFRQKLVCSQRLDHLRLNDANGGNYESYCEGRSSCKNCLLAAVRNGTELVLVYLNATLRPEILDLDSCNCVVSIKVSSQDLCFFLGSVCNIRGLILGFWDENNRIGRQVVFQPSLLGHLEPDQWPQEHLRGRFALQSHCPFAIDSAN